MVMLYRAIRLFTASGVLALATFATSCTDPVKDRAIEQLGGEPGTPNEEHRPGQPCVLCHSDGGPASNKKFAIAGTVFDSDKPGAKGVTGVKVFFIDSANQDRQAVTNNAGNFFIREEDWSDLTFPFKTGVARGAATAKMQTTVNREGSCNFCHGLVASRDSIGPVVAPGGGP